MAEASPQPPFDHEAFLKTLTRRPGVYRMVAADGTVLYVGKARDLRARVSSYFRGSGLTAKTLAMVARIADIQVTVTGSEAEALLLEQSLIKAERPPYNVVLRDDKSYPFIQLTPHEDFPRLRFYRGARNRRQGRFFGPYPSAGAVRETLGVLQKLFQIRNCTDSYFRNRSRPCLQYQIGRCTAPCVGFVTAEEYGQDVRRAVLFLEGRSREVTEELEGAMEQAATDLDFERAARYRDRIAQLRRVQQQQDVVGADQDVDVIVGVQQPGGICVQVMSIRGGHLLGSRDWFPRDELGEGLEAVLAAFVAQYYVGEGGAVREIPKEIVTSHPLEDAALLAAALGEVAGRRVRVTGQVRGQRARWVRLAQANAEQSLALHLADKENVRGRMAALAEGLALDAPPQRLECFDISHTRGEQTVASCVVFDGNGPLKSDYRRFNIEGITPGDDYAAMEQALRRRYTRLKKGEAPLPDVLFIDGGRGQLAQARRVLEELEVEGVRLIGVAKGTTRRAGLETLIDGADGRELALAPTGPAMHLIQHIRDEAHRFAITGHRQRRGKQRTSSELEGIDGVGPKRRRSLLQHFGGLKGVRNASVEELARVPGVSRKLAEQIYGALHSG
ncbi:MAG: excinuclease ABC subunit UvrC [Pseudomonadales bacterium]|jgi:excinuclease ABC subunit C|nr:excinuclease ABC subunit UvrC [Pseudomonadales bacterium]